MVAGLGVYQVTGDVPYDRAMYESCISGKRVVVGSKMACQKWDGQLWSDPGEEGLLRKPYGRACCTIPCARCARIAGFWCNIWDAVYALRVGIADMATIESFRLFVSEGSADHAPECMTLTIPPRFITGSIPQTPNP
eukprot:5012312-Amphidinium_carterae.2